MIKTVKRLTILLFIINLFILINFDAKIEAADEEIIYYSAAEYDYPPFSLEIDGQADGFSVQLLKAVAVEMGINIEFKMDYWSIIKQELIDGELDILPLVGFTPEREDVLDFTVPYIVMRGNIFVRTNDNYITSADDLFGKEVLVLSGDNSEEYARSIGLDDELILTSTYTEAFQLLSSGLYDAILAQGLVGEKILSDEKIRNVTAVYVYDDSGITKVKLNLEGYEQKFCFAVTEGNAELLSILNEGLAIVSANGKYDELYQEWFPFLIDHTASYVEVLRITLLVLIPLLILTLGIAVISVRNQVKLQTEKVNKASISNNIILKAFKTDFQSDDERYTFFIDEILKLSESKDAIMFTIKKNGLISINAYLFNEIKTDCNKHEIEVKLANNLKLMKGFKTQTQFVLNNFQEDSKTYEPIPDCLQYVEHAAYISLVTESNDVLVTMIANKKTIYTEEDITQINILLSGFVAMINRSNYIRQIEFLSYHDSLTELYNRRFIEEQMSKLDLKEKFPITIIFADVNNLKELNDLYGHIEGDKLLKKVADLLLQNSEKNDIIARWGGDEFVIIKPNTTEEIAKLYIQNVSKDSKKEKIKNGCISIAFGYHTKDNHKSNLSYAIVQAEKMMYDEKEKMTEHNRHNNKI